MKRVRRTEGSRKGSELGVRIEGLESRRLLDGVQLGSFLYFAETDAAHGMELWKSDLDGSNKQLVKDIRAGTLSSGPRELTLFNGYIYFSAGGPAGSELYRTDGTADGTELVVDLDPGTSSSIPRGLKVIGSSLYFSADDGEHGAEPYKSDGTAAGTVMVSDVRPGSSGSNPEQFTDAGGVIYFVAGQSGIGEELFRTDGTDAGTWLVKDIRPGSGYSEPSNLTSLGTGVVYLASPAVGVQRLYFSDGSQDSAVQLFPDNVTPKIRHLRSEGGLVYFQAQMGDDQFVQMQTDGTAAGTVPAQTVQIVVVNGTPGDDWVQVSSSGGITTVWMNGGTQTFDESTYTHLELHLGHGRDAVEVADGYSRPLGIYGGNGEDTLTGGDGDDTLVGDGGNDAIFADSAGHDTYVGGVGNDRIDFSHRTKGVHVDDPVGGGRIYNLIHGADGETALFEAFETLIGSQGDDTLSLSDRPSALNVFLFIDGGAGNDSIVLSLTDRSAPTVRGGAGDDFLDVSNKRYFQYPNASSFDANLAALKAYAFGDAGNDTFLGGDTGTEFSGGDGIDALDCSGVAQSSFSWIGYRHIVLYYPVGVKITLDGIANDGNYGFENVRDDIEKIIGSRGPDTITAGSGPTTIVGGDRDDYLTGDGNDLLDGGAGNNTIVTPNSILLNAGVLTIRGTSGADSILVRPKGGNASVLEAILNGVIQEIGAADVTSVFVDSGEGNDRIQLDTISLATRIYSRGGNDTIFGSQAGDRIYAGDGHDWMSSGLGNDTMYGEAGNDRIFGGAGRDYVDGGAGADVLRGEGDQDRIVAKAGEDDFRGNVGDVLNLL